VRPSTHAYVHTVGGCVASPSSPRCHDPGVANLPNVAQTLLAQWKLRGDGEPVQRSGSMVLPVRTDDGVPAVLKISLADAGSEH